MEEWRDVSTAGGVAVAAVGILYLVAARPRFARLSVLGRVGWTLLGIFIVGLAVGAQQPYATALSDPPDSPAWWIAVVGTLMLGFALMVLASAMLGMSGSGWLAKAVLVLVVCALALPGRGGVAVAAGIALTVVFIVLLHASVTPIRLDEGGTGGEGGEGSDGCG